VADRHPIPDRPDLPLDERVAYLELKLAQLWDQVWWLSLPPEKRAEYAVQGFTAPVGGDGNPPFYETIPDPPREGSHGA
jgi:hypothetical protein